ncbi:MAG: MFS transporter, partial [bacterium]
TMFLTPVFGSIYDHIGKGASIMILGSVMLLCVHIVLWIPGLNSVALAVLLVIVLGMAFSLVPSAMWPSVPKIIPEKQLGTAYALIFWVQNWGLMGIPFLLGVVLDKTNPGVAAAKYAGENVNYDYSTTWLIFIVCSALSIIVAFMLKAEDKKKGYGLEQPNIVK